MDDPDATELLERLGLREYEAQALEGLLSTGRTSAPNLAEATGIPKARIYGVLDELSEMGYVEVLPGRPKEYRPRSPREILDRADRNRYREYERFSDRLDGMEEDFLATFGPLYERADEESTPTEELFHVVDVGDPSERETRELYGDATERIAVVTKSFEYFPDVEAAVADAVQRGVAVRVLFLHPDHLTDANREIQAEVVDYLEEEYPAVEYRFSEDPLPLRGTIADPTMEYDTGQAVFLVEEKDVPLHMRQAAVTENGSLVAGMFRYFELIWDHESVASGPA
jgi:sugar-specific transcriptional regulator TrmB